MDPNAALAEIRELVSVITDAEVEGNTRSFRLAEVVKGLDNWIVMGGALPKDWG